MRFLLLSILLIFMASNEVIAQIEVPFYVKTLNYTTRKKEAGVAVKVYEGSSVVQSFVSDGSGEVKMKLPSGKKYKIEVSKAGKVTRSVTVTLSNVNDELIQGNATPSGGVEMSLFDQLPAVDYSYVTSNPATDFYYDPTKGSELLFDQVLADKMIKKVEKIMKDADAAKGQTDAQYNALIKTADGQLAAKKYKEAQASFEQALGLKPTEKYPADKINEIDGILSAEKANALNNQQAESEYQNLVTAADNLFNQKKYEEAITRYQEALAKKQEQHPKDQIVKAQAEITRLKKEAENSQKYTDAIKAGDSFFTQKSYQAAKDKYKEALKWKAEDPYATGKLADIDGKLNAQKSEQDKKKKYDDANTAGDALFAQEKWAEAKAKYQEALTIESASTYSTGKIKECEAKLAEIEKEKAKQDQITKLLAEGNTAFTASQWAPAKAKYQEVLKLDAANAAATARVNDIDAKIAGEKADADKIAKIKQLIVEGDAFAKQTKLPEAKAKYQEAIALKPDPAVQTKIDAIDAQIASANQKAEQKQKYDKAMADAETLFAASKWEEAKTGFQAASTLDPTQALPKQRIIDADKKIAEGLANAQKAEKYAAAMTAGNAALSGNKLPEAKAKFQEAATLDPAQALPKQKIAEIEGLLANAEKQQQIAGFLKEGDAALAKKDITTARAKYQQVLTLDPSNAAASAKMQDVAKLENDLAGEAQKEARFKELKDAGTALIAQTKYQEAKQKLLEAKAIKTDASVDQLIKDCDAKLAEQAKNAELEKQYNALIADAQGMEAAKQYDPAIAKYNEALKLKNEQLPKDRIAAIAKIKEGNANQAKYEAAVTAGNELLAASKLPEAKAKYQEAQALDPNQLLPKQKITEIDNLVANAEQQKQIQALLGAGDAALGKKDLATARAKYQQVLTLEPSNAPAAAKMQEVAKLENDLAGEAQKEARFKQLKDEATALMTQSKYPEAKQKLNETKAIKSDAQVDQLIKDCDAKIAAMAQNAEKDKQYADVIAQAQGFEASKQYDAALGKYNEALAIKNEQMPKDRIAAINQLKAASAGQAKIDADYTAAMKRGNDLLAGKNYTDAIKAYNEALALKPGEKEPAEKAAEAQRLSIADSQTTEDAAYQKILDVGQKAMEEKNYTKAKEMYNRALGFRANDPLPKQKLAEIDALMKSEDDLRKKQTAYTAKVAEAETAAKAGNLQGAITLFEQAKTIKQDELLPDTRIAELRSQLEGSNAAAQATEKRYQEFMAAGNTAESAKDYGSALSRYKEALGVKAKDKAAQDKIAEMQQLLDNASKSDQKKADVQKLIAKADGKYTDTKWLDAKAIYESVLTLDPTNEYAKERSRLCDEQAKKEGEVEVEREYQKILTKANENFDAKNYDRAKDLYERALSFRSTDAYPKQRLAEIDNILHPKPVAVVEDPQKPKALGTETDNSIVEGENALQQAERQRKGRRYSRLKNRVDKTGDKNDSLVMAQQATTTNTNLALGHITKENSIQADQSEDQRKENVQALGVIDTKQKNETIAIEQVQNAAHLDAKNQIDVANRTSEEQNGILDGHAAENSELIKAEKTGMQNGVGQAEQAVYQNRLNNDKQYTNVRIQLEENAIDDTEARIATEHIVRDASQSVVVVTEDNQQRTNQTLEAVKKEVDETGNTVAAKQYEETKQSPLNREEIVKIEQSQNELSQKDNEEHLENTLTYRTYVEGVDAAVSNSTEQRDDARKNNVNVMQVSQKSQEEVDRENYNALMVKTLNTNGAITTEAIKQDQYVELPSTASNNNIEKINQINSANAETDRATTAAQVEKHQGTQASLNSTTQTVQTSSAQGAERASNNEQALKETQSTVNSTNLAQNTKQDDKTQSAKQLLAGIEKKEIVYNEKVANDLGKLYPEGVSQEQFEQKDDEGLLSAVVTRRIVVTNGHGDIYVRIQKLSGLTFTKNDQPTTEYVWQRETQDAKLKRNY